MTIPRFNAQITQIQVPSMKNYQEEQNASISQSLAKFGSSIFGESLKLEIARRGMGSQSNLYKLDQEVSEAASVDRS